MPTAVGPDHITRQQRTHNAIVSMPNSVTRRQEPHAESARPHAQRMWPIPVLSQPSQSAGELCPFLLPTAAMLSGQRSPDLPQPKQQSSISQREALEFYISQSALAYRYRFFQFDLRLASKSSPVPHAQSCERIKYCNSTRPGTLHCVRRR